MNFNVYQSLSLSYIQLSTIELRQKMGCLSRFRSQFATAKYMAQLSNSFLINALSF